MEEIIRMLEELDEELLNDFIETVKPFEHNKIVKVHKDQTITFYPTNDAISDDELRGQVKAFELAKATLAKLIYERNKRRNESNSAS